MSYDSCITSIMDYSNPIIVNTCENKIRYEISNNLNASTLFEMSNHCFNTYKYRLGNVSNPNFEIGSLEYNYIHKSLIELLFSYNPTNLSFSISSANPSLHFIFRLPENISVFVETFINPTDGNSTYLQVLNDSDAILQVGGEFTECLEYLEKTLSDVFPSIDLVCLTY